MPCYAGAEELHLMIKEVKSVNAASRADIYILTEHAPATDSRRFDPALGPGGSVSSPHTACDSHGIVRTEHQFKLLQFYHC